MVIVMMFLEYLHVLNPPIGLAVNMGIQILSVRYVRTLTLLKSVIAGFLFGSISVIGIEWYIFFATPILVRDGVMLLITNLLIYSALGYCYFHFINLGETARRIRILRELYDSPEGLSLNEILNRYNAKHIVDMRIRRLLHNGQIIEKDGRYCIGSPVMLFISKSIIMLKLIVLGKRSEFD